LLSGLFFRLDNANEKVIGYKEKLLASVVVGAKVQEIAYCRRGGYLVVGLRSGTVLIYSVDISS
jgi:hypothetical protein